MKIRVANAPVSWGVFFADDPLNPTWSEVLDGIAAAGYRWLELGPVGFLPHDAAVLRLELSSRGLQTSGTFLYEELSLPDARAHILEVARRACSLIQATDGPQLVAIDAMAPKRMATAGRSDDAERLADEGWERLLDNARGVTDVADEFGLDVVYHPHVGTYVEFEDEIERFVEQLGDDRVKLCIDTGHSAYAGIDPVALYRRYAERVVAFHFKDIDAAVRAEVVRDRLGWDDAVRAGIFRPLGQGSVDFPGLREALLEHGFNGWATVEQDTETGQHAAATASARASLDYLRSIGLAGADSASR